MPGSPQTLELFVPKEAAAPGGDVRPGLGRSRLWLAVCLPNLAFESLETGALPVPAVVVEPQKGQLFVTAASASARKVGIEPGHKLTSALALAASLRVFERAPHREQAFLESLASWSQKLTPVIATVPPEGLLLEVGGSLKLFGSIEALKAELHAELARRGLEFRLCAAPTATAALWLARAAHGDVLEASALAGCLSALPLAVTRWPLGVQALLRDLGARTLGECTRLPRDGFARRVGNPYLRELDRAHGRRFDMPVEFKAPRGFRSRIELMQESADSALLSKAIDLMLDELAAELRRQQAQVTSLDIEFEHLHRDATAESFDFLEPVHDLKRLKFLVEDRLERKALPQPAVALRLKSGLYSPLELEEADLFEGAPVEAVTPVLLERLKERFGAAAVYGLKTIPEHRPERAWAKALWSARNERCTKSLTDNARPLWLLPSPVPLSSPSARKHYRGSLAISSGSERIESGWWDGQDVGRDYYLAVSSGGERLWVFRDRHDSSWHLHGLFG
jgi:protein ImuB